MEAARKAGMWRLEFGPTEGGVGGSLRALAGDVASLSGDAVVFRLGGRASERLVFTFRTDE